MLWLLGLALYAFERAPNGVPGWLAVAGAGVGPWLPAQAPWAAVLRDNAPSFVHTGVFVLLAVVWLARSRGQAWAIGIGVWALDAAFEIAQGLAATATAWPAWARWALGGTFDPADLAAQALGWAMAMTLAQRCGAWSSRA